MMALVKAVKMILFLSILLKMVTLTRSYTTSCNDICHYNPMLKYADCSTLNLNEVPEGSGCPEMETLDLDQNNFSNISRTDFTGYQGVKNLDLSQNHLGFLYPGIFDYLSDLNNLFISSNRIVEVNNGTFSGLLKLSYLYLDQNEISTIEKGVFCNNTLLSLLHIGFNKLTTLPQQIFQTNTFLKYIYLLKNNINSLPNNLLLGLTNLKVLDLSHNNLRTIPKMFFAHLESLELLKLSYNRLISIPPYTDIPLGNLNLLDLNNNTLTDISYILPYMNKVEIVTLENNPWQCDCDVLEGYDNSQLNTSDIICGSPKEFQGLHITETLQLCTQKCNTQTHTTPTLTITNPVLRENTKTYEANLYQNKIYEQFSSKIEMLTVISIITMIIVLTAIIFFVMTVALKKYYFSTYLSGKLENQSVTYELLSKLEKDMTNLLKKQETTYEFT